MQLFLEGASSFRVITDHRLLEGIFKKEIFQMENTRLQRMRENFAAYSFTVSWVPGKTHSSELHTSQEVKTVRYTAMPSHVSKCREIQH